MRQHDQGNPFVAKQSKLLVLFAIGLALLTASGCCQSCGQTKTDVRDYVTIASKAVWTWSEDDAPFAHSVAKHLANYEVEPVLDVKNWDHRRDLDIRVMQGGKQVLTFRGHSRTVFTRLEDVLFVTAHDPICNGCEVFALDLKTRKELWRTPMQGIGPQSHSEYYNGVAIETDGHAIIIHGNESHGKYIEYLDKDTGKMLANKVFK